MRNEDEDDSVVIFLKDDISSNNMHQNGRWNDLESLVEIASSFIMVLHVELFPKVSILVQIGFSSLHIMR